MPPDPLMHVVKMNSACAMLVQLSCRRADAARSAHAGCKYERRLRNAGAAIVQTGRRQQCRVSQAACCQCHALSAMQRCCRGMMLIYPLALSRCTSAYYSHAVLPRANGTAPCHPCKVTAWWDTCRAVPCDWLSSVQAYTFTICTQIRIYGERISCLLFPHLATE